MGSIAPRSEGRYSIKLLGTPQPRRNASEILPFHLTSVSMPIVEGPRWITSSSPLMLLRSLSANIVPCKRAPFRFALCRLAPCRFATVRLAPRRFALSRLALRRFTSARFAMYRSAPFRLALSRFAMYRSASRRFASAKIAPSRYAPSRYAPRRSAACRFAPSKFALPALALGGFSACRSGCTSGFAFRHAIHTSTPCRRIARCSSFAIAVLREGRWKAAGLENVKGQCRAHSQSRRDPAPDESGTESGHTDDGSWRTAIYLWSTMPYPIGDTPKPRFHCEMGLCCLGSGAISLNMRGCTRY